MGTESRRQLIAVNGAAVLVMILSAAMYIRCCTTADWRERKHVAARVRRVGSGFEACFCVEARLRSVVADIRDCGSDRAAYESTIQEHGAQCGLANHYSDSLRTSISVLEFKVRSWLRLTGQESRYLALCLLVFVLLMGVRMCSHTKCTPTHGGRPCIG